MLTSLQLVQPTTVAEASRALQEFGEKAKIYAGGAELLLLQRHGLLHTEVLVNIKRIERLQRLSCDESALRVGACVSHRDLETSSMVRARAPSFAYAESQVANIRVRNQGTLGGNLCFNDPHSDPGTVLLMHDATVMLESERGEREMILEDFFLDMYTTALAPDELLVEVKVPFLPERMKSTYLRLHRYQRPTLGVAVAAHMSNGAIEDARLAVGCIGPRALRLKDLEAKIAGAALSEVRKIVADEATYLRDRLDPVDDLLGSAEYKLYMASQLLGDALEQVAGRRGVA
jgi:aerobic carbon-monoxide dehydrogenase medium subunit